jgi:hypothetical protein
VSRRRSRNQKRSRRTGPEKKIDETKPSSEKDGGAESSDNLPLPAAHSNDDIDREVDDAGELPQPAAIAAEAVRESSPPMEHVEEDNAEVADDDDEIETTPPQPSLSLRQTSESDEAGNPPMPIIDETSIYSGDILRQIREHRGITLRTISNITRIGVPSLMAIEEERYEDLPNARIYVLGFVRCLAHEIGLDREIAAKSYIHRWQGWWDERSNEERKSYRQKA